jgi:hypothetical protein
VRSLIALLAAAAPWSAQAAGVSDKEIVIGSHMDLSGPVAAGMPQLRNGTQMRFDEVSVKYAEFGDFYIGLSLPLGELFRRVLL